MFDEREQHILDGRFALQIYFHSSCGSDCLFKYSWLSQFERHDIVDMHVIN